MLGPRVRLLAVCLTMVAAIAVAPISQATPTGEACDPAWSLYDRPTEAAGTSAQRDVTITMSDGVNLSADAFVPADASGVVAPVRRPTILTITGYNKSGGGPSSLVRYGYNYVVVDDRGTGSSGGQWDVWSARTQADYGEVIDWITAQPWSDGTVGVTGGSYLGITSLFAAAQQHPAVRAVFSVVPMGDAYRDLVFTGGEVNVIFIPVWLAGVNLGALRPSAPTSVLLDHLKGLATGQAPLLVDGIVGGPTVYDGAFWRQRSPLEAAKRITAPTFIVGGTDDIFQRGEPMLYEALADHTDARLVLGPWTHFSTGSGLPAGDIPDIEHMGLQWFDHWLRGFDNGAECTPPVTQWLKGADRYDVAPAWPRPDLSANRWYLHGNGGLTTAAPRRAEPGRSFLQRPVSGLCSPSTNQWTAGAAEPGLGWLVPCFRDNRFAEFSALTYTSAPFATDVTINGPIEADVWLRTTGLDSAVVVTVTDVAPDGSSSSLSNGMLLASHRAVDASRSRMLDGKSIQPWHPFTQGAKQPVRLGQPMLLPVEIFPTSAVIAAGHRLRVSITPADFPRALATGPAQINTLAGVATVLSDPSHPTSITLPIVTR